MSHNLHSRRVLLIISGGIAAYKSLDLIRRLRALGMRVRCVLTKGGEKFVTALSVEALSEEKVYTDLWSLTDEQAMGHIRLAREADLVLVAPASANLMAKMAHGLADDLASTLLLANTQPVMVAPSMNVEMWKHPATVANCEILRRRGVVVLGPDKGEMACGEVGEGRMLDPLAIENAIVAHFSRPGPLAGKKALVTSGPTFEPLDPVRYIGNRSSGKQGHAIAEALLHQGADTILITGPSSLPDPVGIKSIHVETARDMLLACEQQLPCDIAICAAAVADWRPSQERDQKIKKSTDAMTIRWVENPDILTTLAASGNRRPRLVVGFAAETEDILANARKKLDHKNCDWIVANEVGPSKAFGRDENKVTLIRRVSNTEPVVEEWPLQTKQAIAKQLVEAISTYFIDV